MEQVSKEEFISWKNMNMTEVFMHELLKEIEGYASALVNSAGLDPATDRWKAGYIRGLQYFLEWRPEFVEITDDDEFTDNGSQDSN